MISTSMNTLEVLTMIKRLLSVVWNCGSSWPREVFDCGNGCPMGTKKPPIKKKILKCYRCYQEGHKRSECPKAKPRAELAKVDNLSFASLVEGNAFSATGKMQWFVDSGCSDHLVKDKNLFESLTPLAVPEVKRPTRKWSVKRTMARRHFV